MQVSSRSRVADPQATFSDNCHQVPEFSYPIVNGPLPPSHTCWHTHKKSPSAWWMSFPPANTSNALKNNKEQLFASGPYEPVVASSCRPALRRLLSALQVCFTAVSSGTAGLLRGGFFLHCRSASQRYLPELRACFMAASFCMAGLLHSGFFLNCGSASWRLLSAQQACFTAASSALHARFRWLLPALQACFTAVSSCTACCSALLRLVGPAAPSRAGRRLLLLLPCPASQHAPCSRYPASRSRPRGPQCSAPRALPNSSAPGAPRPFPMAAAAPFCGGGGGCGRPPSCTATCSRSTGVWACCATGACSSCPTLRWPRPCWRSPPPGAAATGLPIGDVPCPEGCCGEAVAAPATATAAAANQVRSVLRRRPWLPRRRTALVAGERRWRPHPRPFPPGEWAAVHLMGACVKTLCTRVCLLLLLLLQILGGWRWPAAPRTR